MLGLDRENQILPWSGMTTSPFPGMSALRTGLPSILSSLLSSTNPSCPWAARSPPLIGIVLQHIPITTWADTLSPMMTPQLGFCPLPW